MLISRRTLLIFLIPFLLAAAWTHHERRADAQASGVILYVDAGSGCSSGCGDSWSNAYPTLQDALAAARSGDEVWVAAGVYYPDEGPGQIDNDRFATFDLRHGVALYGGFAGYESSRHERNWETNSAVLSGDIDQSDITDASGVVTDTVNMSGDNSYTVLWSTFTRTGTVLDGFTITAGRTTLTAGGARLYGSEATLANLTFSGNEGFSGAALSIEDGDHTIENVTFHGNYAYRPSSSANGGALAVVGGNSTVVVNDASFSNNRSTGRGGAIHVEPGATLTLSGAIVQNNHSDNVGGGIYNGGILNLNQVTIRDNNTQLSGGGIHHYGETAFLTAKDVTILDNSAGDSGGGLTVSGGAALINVIIAGNMTLGDEWGLSGDGGGIFNFFWDAPVPHNVTMTNVLISGNHAAKSGGGMTTAGPGNQSLTNVTVSGNTANESGGGLYVHGSFLGVSTVSNSIIWNNAAPDGAQIGGNLSALSAANSTVQGGFGGEGNLDADPLFIEAVNPAMAPTTDGDLRLQGISPARDAGNTDDLPADFLDLDGDGDTAEPLPYDLNGTPRVLGSAVNMGAYELPQLTVAPQSGLSTVETGSSDVVTVTLHLAPSAAVTITLSSSDAHEAMVSPSQLFFDAGSWSHAQTFTVTGVDDHRQDGDAPFTIELAASSTDVVYDGLSQIITGVNEDDDTPGISIPAEVIVGEGSNSGYAVTLDSQPTQAVTVTASSSGSAALSPTFLVFDVDNWHTPQTILISAPDDDVDNDGRSETLSHSSSSADVAYAGLSAPAATLVIADEDEAGISASPSAGLRTDEAGSSDALSVTLDSQPTDQVVIFLSSNNGSEATLDTSYLLFTAANWQTPQTVTVTGVDDDVDDGNVAYTIAMNVISNDPLYNHRTLSVPGVNEDDADQAGLAFDPEPATITVADGETVTFTLALTSQPTDAVTVTLGSSDPEVATIQPQILQFDAGSWPVPQMLTVTGVAEREGPMPFSILIAVSSVDAAYEGLDPGEITGINDNGFTYYFPAITAYSHEAPDV